MIQTYPPQIDKTFDFETEEIIKLKKAYNSAKDLADSIDSITNLDDCFTEVVHIIFHNLKPDIKSATSLYTHTSDEPFIDWFDSLEI